MSAEYVRRHYGVDFKRGDRIGVDGRPGFIVSFPDQYLGVRFDGDKHTSRAHPTWRVERLTENHPRGCRCSPDCECLADEDAARAEERRVSWWI